LEKAKEKISPPQASQELRRDKEELRAQRKDVIICPGIMSGVVTNEA